MFPPQVLRIREGQVRQAAKGKNIANPIQSLVRQLFSYQSFQLFARQMVFLLVVFFFEFIVSERVFLDPFIAQTITSEVLDAIEQIDCSIMFAVVAVCRNVLNPSINSYPITESNKSSFR